jgi:hypothetical protein
MFMDEDFVAKIIAPLMQIDQCSTICISTENGSKSDHPCLSDQYSSDGNLMSKAYRFSSVCASCIAKGETENCPHLVHRLPPWLSLRKQEVVRWLMSNSKGDTSREILGIPGEDNSRVFSHLKIDALFAKPKFATQDYIPTIFVAIDPNTGKWDSRPGGGSDYAVLSFFEYRGETILLGAESIDAHGIDDFKQHIYNHLTRIRLLDATRSAKIIVAAEMNLGHEASWLQDFICARFRDIHFMQETDLKVGVPTSAPLKKEMALELRDRLNAGTLRVSEDFVSSSAPTNEVLGKLKQQMYEYAEVRIPSTDPLKPPSIHFSGKKGGKRDDLVIALQLALVWSKVAKRSSKYGI